MYVMGCHNLIIAVDHAPLVKLLSDRHLQDIPNPRLLRLKEKTLNFNYTIKHIPGTKNVGPDALSRNPSTKPDTDDKLEDTVMSIIASHSHAPDHELPTICVSWDRIEAATKLDDTLQALAEHITHGFPSTKMELPDATRPYWDVRSDLHCVGDAIAYGCRVVVPKCLRSEVLDGLHSAHQGVTGMKARAHLCVYWPGMSNDIANRRRQCRLCDNIAPSLPALPPAPPTNPEYPFQLVVADYFDLAGRKFLVYADRYTGWPAVSEPKHDKNDTRNLMRSLREWFSIYGVPEEIASDGGPPFPSHATKTFLKSWGVRHRISSAYLPHSNGRAELAVKVTKRALMNALDAAGRLDSDKVTAALLQYRNTPLQGIGHSPSQLLYGRLLRDHIPTPKELLMIRPEWSQTLHDREVALAKRNVKNIKRYTERHATRDQPPLAIGDCVLVQNQHGPHARRWEKTGIICEKLDNDQYTVHMHGSGRLTTRNRQFIRNIEPVCIDTPLPSMNPPEHSVAADTITPPPTPTYPAAPTAAQAQPPDDDTQENEDDTPLPNDDDQPTCPPQRRSTRPRNRPKHLADFDVPIWGGGDV